MSAQTYSPLAKALHWLMALPIILVLLFGQHMMGDHGARFWPSVHVTAGFVLLLMLGLRVYWRLRTPPPALVSSNFLEALAARFTHLALYAAMLLIPLTGWLAYTEHVKRSLGVQPASLFGYRIPLLPDFGFNWHFIHKWGGKAALLLITLHVLAALKHHFFNKDETLKRMLR